ncbi:hypothetical protein ACFUC1_19395 [Pedococcus sp. NPDC057267]|uniref:hypothetical protein n=1 Tax=Pedococcus sp. NPDC057267 TaxID=3346077 RepID=UPI003625DBA2
MTAGPATARLLAAVTAAAALAAPAAGLAGCSGSPAPEPAPTARPLTWTPVPLPRGNVPLTLADSTSAVVVGATASTGPTLWSLGPDGRTVASVPLSPHSTYAFPARWAYLAVDGQHVVGVGRAIGGAHGLPRWTVWDGSTSGVQERPQPFETFGGPRAGGLAGVATGAGRDVAVGAWDDGGPGLDGAVWLRTSGRWDRLPSAGTPLASTSTDLVQVASVGLTGPPGDAPVVVVAGATTDLSGSAPAQRPVAWTSPDPRGPWQRHDLPATTAAARATGSTCDVTGCWLVGTDGDVAALWHLTDGSGPAGGGRGVAVERVPLPGTVAGTPSTGALVALDGATTWVVVRGHSAAALVHRDGAGTWSVWTAPPGDVQALSARSGHLAVVAAAGGTRRLLVAAAR